MARALACYDPAEGFTVPHFDQTAIDVSHDYDYALRNRLASIRPDLLGLYEKHRHEIIAEMDEVASEVVRSWWTAPPSAEVATAWREALGYTIGNAPSDPNAWDNGYRSISDLFSEAAKAIATSRNVAPLAERERVWADTARWFKTIRPDLAVEIDEAHAEDLRWARGEVEDVLTKVVPAGLLWAQRRLDEAARILDERATWENTSDASAILNEVARVLRSPPRLGAFAAWARNEDEGGVVDFSTFEEDIDPARLEELRTQVWEAVAQEYRDLCARADCDPLTYHGPEPVEQMGFGFAPRR